MAEIGPIPSDYCDWAVDAFENSRDSGKPRFMIKTETVLEYEDKTTYQIETWTMVSQVKCAGDTPSN